MVRDPRVVFDQLFGVGATPRTARERRVEDKSILDWLRSRSRRSPQQGSGRADRRGWPTTSTTCARSSAASRRSRRRTARRERELPGAPAGVPDSFEEHVKLMFDLQALRLRPTSRASSPSSWAATPRTACIPRAATTAFHSASHHQDREDRITEFAKINKYHVGMLPYFLEKLKNTPTATVDLLDNTLVIYGSPMGNSNVHNHKRCPLFFAGHAGGHAEGRRAHQGADGTPMANALLTAAHALGLDEWRRCSSMPAPTSRPRRASAPTRRCSWPRARARPR
jgi:hypothetical protein